MPVIFFDIYTGSDLGSFEDFIGSPPSKGHAMLKHLEKALDENVHETDIDTYVRE